MARDTLVHLPRKHVRPIEVNLQAKTTNLQADGDLAVEPNAALHDVGAGKSEIGSPN